MDKKLKEIFEFLKSNRSYNKELQTRFYTSVLSSQEKRFEKIISLLYHIANTQSQPKIDKLAEFYRKIYENEESICSFKGFLTVINSNKNYQDNYFGLYHGMKSQNGWGEKTSALFTKTIYHLHNKEYPKDLKIWPDAPTELKNEDSFYLPVDAVIIAIFKQLDNTKWTFSKVNSEIKKHYKGKDIEVWDDLWFWGFITQLGTGENREMKWNINKYWTLRESDKSPEVIKEIKLKAEFFLKIIKK